MESILIFLGALFVSALLPTLLLRYFYDTATLLEEPAALQYIPVASFVIGVGYFLFAIFGNMARGKKIRQLQQEIADMSPDCNCGSNEVDISDEELAELEKMVDEVLETRESSETAAEKKKPARKKTAKRGTKSKKSSK